MTKAAQVGKRLEFLDLTKGFLVALMVIYHSLNYTNQYQLSFRFLSFLPPSFILITGFLIAHVYYPRFQAGEAGLTLKLLLRSLRLVLLFLVLNVVAQFVRSPAYGRSVGVEAFFEQWDQVFISGGSRLAVFEVLLPIAYLIALAPPLMQLARWHRLSLPLITAAVIGACFVMEYHNNPVANLRFIGVGLIGMLVGKLWLHPMVLGRGFWISGAALAAYALFAAEKGYLYAVQLAGAIIALVFFCGASIRLSSASWFGRWLGLVGQYSLVAYVVQIGVLQVLSRFLGRPDPLSLPALCYFVTTLLVMTLSILAAKWLRARSAHADRIYKLIFA